MSFVDLPVKRGFDSSPLSHFSRTPGPDLNYGSLIIQLLFLRYYNRRFCLQTSRARAGHYSIIPVFQHSNCERSELSSALAFLAAKYSVTVKIFFAIGIPGQLYVS